MEMNYIFIKIQKLNITQHLNFSKKVEQQMSFFDVTNIENMVKLKFVTITAK